MRVTTHPFHPEVEQGFFADPKTGVMMVSLTMPVKACIAFSNEGRKRLDSAAEVLRQKSFPVAA